MNLIKSACLSISLTLAMSFSLQAQSTSTFATKKGKLTDEQLKRWSHLDLAKDSIPGMSVDRVYTDLTKNKKSKKIIVAVLDSGMLTMKILNLSFGPIRKKLLAMAKTMTKTVM